MSALLFFGLAFQAASLGVMRWRLGRQMWTHIGFLFVAVAATYHGLVEVLQRTIADRNPLSMVVAQHSIDVWVFIVGISLMGFAVVYVSTVKPAVQVWAPVIQGWRLLAVFLALPVAMLVSGMSSYWIGGLTNEFVTLGLPIVSYAVLQRRRSRAAFMAVVVAQSFVLALLGQRLEVGIAAALLLILARRHGLRRDRVLARRATKRRGRRLSTHRTLQVVAVVIAAWAVLSLARATAGREAFAGTSLGERVSALRGDVRASADSRSDVSFAENYVYRLDGNTWPALVYEHRRAGWMGLTTAANALRVAVPSFLSPGKFSGDKTLDEETVIDRHFGLQAAIDVDYLPTQMGTVLTYYGPWFLIFATMTAGWLFARLDSWIHRSSSTTALLVATGAAFAALQYERPMATYPLAARAVLVLAAALVAIRGMSTVAAPGVPTVGAVAVTPPVARPRRRIVIR